MLDFLSHRVKSRLVLADALDADIGLLVDRVADCPLDNTEIDTILLAHIDNFVEDSIVKKMSN